MSHRTISSTTALPTIGELPPDFLHIHPKMSVFVSPRDLWRFRGLLIVLAWRDIKIRYKQAALGVSWAVIQPLLSTIAFSVFFGELAKVPSDGIPYPVFYLVAFTPWNYFSNSVSRCSFSLVSNSQLLSKIYFPRLILPMSSILPGLLDYAITLLLLFGLMLWYGIPVSWTVVFMIPLLTVLTILPALGIGLWLSALNVSFRDIGHAVPFLMQIWMLATPIIYPMSLIPETYRPLLFLNPMVTVTEAYRAAFFQGSVASQEILIGILVSLFVFVSGILFFSKAERKFADVI